MKIRFSPSNQYDSRWQSIQRRFACPPPRESLNNESSDSGSARKLERTEKDLDNNDEIDRIIVENLRRPEEWIIHSKTTSEPGVATTNFSETGSINFNLAYETAGRFKCICNFIQYRISPGILFFLNPAFENPLDEAAYQNELWYSSKTTAIWGALFMLVIWLLAFGLPRPWSLWNKIQIYSLGPAFTLPLLPAVLYDFPKKRKRIWQILLVLASWLWAIGNSIDMRLCGYYTKEPNCDNRDFQNTLFYVVGLSTVSLFALQQSRLVSAIGALVWIIVTGVVILPVRHAYARNVANVVLYGSFILFTHFQREMADRRLWTLRAELKVQYKAKNRAQISERKSNDSKRRFTNYIFHEVRVPLNTALLAVQNIEAEKALKDSGSEFPPKDLTVEYAALKGSLDMMSQVLNDVLDHSRMERGGFSSVSRPFSLKLVMDSIVIPLRIQAAARELELEFTFDPRIVTGDGIDGTGIVLGDEMRLRQVVNNLASNACKFTEPGGKVSIATTLVYDSLQSPSQRIPSSPTRNSRNSFSRSPPSPSLMHSTRSPPSPSLVHSSLVQSTTSDVIVVRIAITDTGVGIRPKDLEDNRLFSAYVQTEVGHRQGGKGTGLGLSLVRQIVLLSGGRLGVRSQFGEGSTFWVEFALPIYSNRADSISAISSDESDFKFQPLKNREQYEPPTLSIIDSISTTNSGSGTSEIPSINPIPPTPDVERTEFISDEDERTPRISQSTTMTMVTSEGSTLLPPLQTSIAPAPVLPKFKPKNKPTLALDLGPLGPLKILVVDDDLLTRKLMCRMLERLKCTVETAENGAIALEILSTKSFDLIFLDNQMPVLSGRECVQKIRELKGLENLLVVGVTAIASNEDQETYLASGVNFVLTKPVLESALLKSLLVAIERRNNQIQS